MRKKKSLTFILCILTAAIALSSCKSKKEQPKETVMEEQEEIITEQPKETILENKEYETDDDTYETFETLLQNLADGLNEGDVVQMRKAFVGGNVPGAFLTVSGNYILDFQLIGAVNDAILEGDDIERVLIDKNLIDEEYAEYVSQSTEACALEVAITQTTISDNSVNTNNEAIIIVLKIDGKWAVVPWI